MIIVLGAGISGLGAGYSLMNRGIKSLVLERDATYGGLCGNFEIQGFRFDRFVHLSFSDNDIVNKLFDEASSNSIKHTPNPSNFYKEIWMKHPAQNNLYPLDEKEKTLIVDDFKKRLTISDTSQLHNYEEWLRCQYGNYFAENFPMRYTRKYWMCEARDLETKWIGNRLYQPSIEEVIKGCQSKDTPVTYYAKEMRYPSKGGFKSFLGELVKGQEIQYNSEVIEINPALRILKTKSGENYRYENLISSLPLPVVLDMIENVPDNICEAGRLLKCTSGYQVSIGLKSQSIPPYLWWYIYDEDILPARVYSPSLKSLDNAPMGCSSLQMEIYCERNKYTDRELYDGSVKKLINLGIIKEEDILFVDIRFEKYANVIFDHQIYEARKVVRDYLFNLGIITIGRFGEWDYFWSDQSLLSGISVVL